MKRELWRSDFQVASILRRCRKRLGSRLSIVCAFLPAVSFAQQNATELEEVVVTGTRVPRLLKDTPVQTRVITARDIERSDATDISELLQQTLPGIEFSYAMNQQTHLNYGGFGGQSVLFLVDGERMAGETMDDIDFSRIAMNNVERIEIVRGASSALYGSNAGGGVVNIITKEATKKFSGSIDARFSHNNSRRYMANVSARIGQFANTLSATASRIDSYDVHSAADPATRVISTIYGHKTLNISDRLSYKPIDALQFSAHAGFYMQEMPREMQTPERYRSYSGGMKGEWAITSADMMHLSYSFDQYDKSQFRKYSGQEFRSYSNVQNSVRALYSHNFSEGHYLTAGVDYMYDWLLNSHIIEGERHQDSFDIFTQFDWLISRQWEVVGALRYDWYSDGRQQHVTPKISARYTPIYNLNIRASIGMGFRAPSLKEKYYEFDMAGIWIVKGNPELQPERSNNFNLSADYTRGQYNFTASACYNRIYDRITTGLPYYLPGDNKQLYLDYINLANFHSAGIELTARGAWRCGLSATFSYAYTYEHTTSDKAGNAAASQYMPARPHSLTARADWHKEFSSNYTLEIGLNGRFLSGVANREYKDYYNLEAGVTEVHYPAYTIWKISGTQMLRQNFKLTIGVDNIFNYRPRYYYLNAPLTNGATLFVSIGANI